MRIFFITLLTVLVYGCSNGQNSTTISAVDLNKLISKEKNIQLVDVRTPEEFEKGHISNATNINWNGEDFTDKIKELDKTQTVYVYCLSGGRSAQATTELRKNGFEVIEMNGGMMEWRAKDLPEANAKKNAVGMTVKQYNELLKSDKLVLIDFYAVWCGPCKRMEPYLKKISEELGDQVEVIRIDTDKNEELAKALKVAGLPLLKLYKNQELVWDQLGFVEEGVVREQIKLALD